MEMKDAIQEIRQHISEADYTSIEAVERITAMEEPVKRNFRITQSYYEMSLTLAGRLAPGANWCTFATWASRQAGQTIRGEDLEHAMKDWISSPEASAIIADLVRESAGAIEKEPLVNTILKVIDPTSSLHRASDFVARGNRKVYAEIAHVFAQFLSDVFEDRAFDEARITRFCNGLRAGNPPEGQAYLRRAFGHYYQALFATDEKARAELLLLANLEVGFHEQTRLQPEIAGALNSSLEDPVVYVRRLLDILFPERARWIVFSWQVFRFFGRKSRLETVMHHFAEALRGRLRLFLTKHLMTLSISDNTLDLGADLKGQFPRLLQHLEHSELKVLLAQVDTTPDSLKATGALDWSDFSGRMHFIADLFRSTSMDSALLSAPFLQDETEAIMRD